jgi:archaellum biogenesis ATPase FlaH
MAKKFEHLQAPDALRELRGWLVWHWRQKPGSPKPSKMPYYVSGKVRTGTHGSEADRANLATFEEAKAFAEKNDFAGVGLALMPEFGITALDFDNCVKDGVIDPRVEELTAGTYAELSPSGNGIRAFVTGSSPDHKDSTPEDGSFGFETFHAKGFVTFTGHVTELTELTGTENTVAPMSDKVVAFCGTRFKRAARVRAECVGAGKPTFGMSPEQITELLNKLPDDLHYEDWRNVGMAVHHETEGEGFDIWHEWSMNSPKYTSQEYCQGKWSSFGRNTSADYTTMGTILQMIRDGGGETGLETASPDEFEALPMPVGGKFNIRSHADFAGQVRSVRWIVKDFLPAATLGVLFGESGSGKTFASYDLCAAVCRGIEWNGKRVTKGRVLYVVAEGVAGFVNRIKAYCHQQGIKPSDIDMDVISDLTPNLLEPAQITDLIKDIKKREPYDLIVMDTFAQVMPGANENSGEDVGKALAECKRIHRHTGAMVLLVHHSGKDASKGARGWSGLRAAADVELEVLRSDELRSISVTKLKDGQDGANIGFKLHTVILGEDEDGDDITSCIVEYTNTGRATKEKGAVVGPKERQILMVLNEVFGLGTDQKMPLPELIEAAAAQLAPPVDGKRDNRKRDVTRCIDSLSAKNYLFVEDGMVKLPESGNA